MNWSKIESIEQVNQLFENSIDFPQLIFKHSTRCSISSMALRRAEDYLPIPNLAPHYLDLIQYREVSNFISSISGVVHQSPQAILIKNKKVIYHQSHGSIDWPVIKELCLN